LVRLYRKYQDRGFSVVAVNTWDEDERTLTRFKRRHSIPYPILVEGSEVAADWGVSSIPTGFFIDEEGKVVKVIDGFSQGDEQHLEDTIKRMLKDNGDE
jgi:peroxiredoxin